MSVLRCRTTQPQSLRANVAAAVPVELSIWRRIEKGHVVMLYSVEL